MSTTVGNLEPFDGEDFVAYQERLEAFFLANNIGIVAADAEAGVVRAVDKRKVAVTISLIGKKTYSTLKDLCLPGTPVEKSYQDLCTLLGNYFKPRVSEVAETYRFHQAIQSESVIEFANRVNSTGCHEILCKFI